jgi:hypothetical protein
VTRRGTPQGEALTVWVVLAADVLAILFVYAMLAPSELFAVSRDGIAGGLSRALVQLNFPAVAGAAIPMALLALDVLPRRAWLVGGPAIALCVVMAWPGVVDPEDLDARAVNALPAVGVLLVLALTVAAGRRSGFGLSPPRSGDRLRLIAAGIAILVSLPWITAELGFHLPGELFLTDELYAEPGKAPTAAVHLGHHHGLMGTLLVLAALLLSRPRLTSRRLRPVYAALVAAMLVYGRVNLVQDLWHEQVVKRDWSSWDVPSALTPELSVIWALMVAAALLAFAAGFARRDPARADTR